MTVQRCGHKHVCSTQEPYQHTSQQWRYYTCNRLNLSASLLAEQYLPALPSCRSGNARQDLHTPQKGRNESTHASTVPPHSSVARSGAAPSRPICMPVKKLESERGWPGKRRPCMALSWAGSMAQKGADAHKAIASRAKWHSFPSTLQTV